MYFNIKPSDRLVEWYASAQRLYRTLTGAVAPDIDNLSGMNLEISSNSRSIPPKPEVLDFSDPTHIFLIAMGQNNIEEGRFAVHRQVACYYLEVVRVGLYSKVKTGASSTPPPGGEGVFELPCSKDGVALLLQWLYFNHLRPLPIDITDEQLLAHSKALINLWAVADFLILPQLKDIAIDRLDMCTRMTPIMFDLFKQEWQTIWAVSHDYNRSTQVLKHFFMDWFITSLSEEEIENFDEETGGAITLDIALAANRRLRNKPRPLVDHYHVVIEMEDNGEGGTVPAGVVAP
ncbi:hypothetical protein GLAREA_00238 [Glarea lozoyensis ATCC 20868]|uniref:BTB domain-containing protein n=1 Tax=Glarea lozoyensis (strain ATCC 20868 / MF5171) TaxID=1116229 RepID=S3CTS8_GLAL2|nr:uncharacterized protein GLAREA_00238 [Glarea lozoyensis ATCC 20868]EPE29080.1 hypothetical protein GLAREA_00238 [Glarea lozoyensis ATCC 20868]